MNRFRCFVIAAIVLIFGATSGLAGVIQGPGKSDPAPVVSDGVKAQPTWTEEVQIVSQDARVMMVEMVLTLFDGLA